MPQFIGSFSQIPGTLGTTQGGTGLSTTVANAVLITSGAGAPIYSTTLPAVNGSALTNLNAGNLATGTVATARLGTGTANSTAFLRGDQTWSNTLTGTLTVSGNTLTVSNSGNDWTSIIAGSGTSILRFAGTGNGAQFQNNTNVTGRIYTNGRWRLGNNNADAGEMLQVAGNGIFEGTFIRITTSFTPASATAAGIAGTICWDANYVYLCLASGNWRRAAHSTW